MEPRRSYPECTSPRGAWIALLAVMLVSACYRVGYQEDACDGVDCDGKGSCEALAPGVAFCRCDPGFSNDGPTSCVPVQQLSDAASGADAVSGADAAVTLDSATGLDASDPRESGSPLEAGTGHDAELSWDALIARDIPARDLIPIEVCESNGECEPDTCIVQICRPLSAYGQLCDDHEDCRANLGCGEELLCRHSDGRACSNNIQCVNACVFEICAERGQAGSLCDEPDDCQEGLSCELQRCIQAVPTWFNADFENRVRLAFDNLTRAELNDFPVLVVLNPSRIDYTRTGDGGADLRFVDSDNSTLLDHEVELWDATGLSYVWVRVPQIAGFSNDDFIWLYYDNVNADDAQNPDGVWLSEYLGVWHLGEDATQATPTVAHFHDSTSGANHGTSLVSAPGKEGAIGRGQAFDGVDDYIAVADIAMMDGVSQLSYSAWAQPAELRAEQGILQKGFDVASRIRIGSGDGSVQGGTADIRVSLGNNVSGGVYTASPGVPLQLGDWGHWFVVFDGYAVDLGGPLQVYYNGERQEAVSWGDLPFTTAEVAAGLDIGRSAYWFGSIDEVRIANVARSSHWIEAQYLSMADGFITYLEDSTP